MASSFTHFKKQEGYLYGQSFGDHLHRIYQSRYSRFAYWFCITWLITVTNTSANWYAHTDYFDKWETRELSPYFEIERKSAKDSVNGGLYGPVKLRLE